MKKITALFFAATLACHAETVLLTVVSGSGASVNDTNALLHGAGGPYDGSLVTNISGNSIKSPLNVSNATFIRLIVTNLIIGTINNALSAQILTGFGNDNSVLTETAYPGAASDPDGYNVAGGFFAMYGMTNGLHNVAIGINSLAQYSAGSFNVAIGSGALDPFTGTVSGDHNIAVGYQAGNQYTNGSYNIDIGNSGLTGDQGIIRIGNANNTATYLAGVINGNGSGISNHLGFGTNTPRTIYAHITNGVATWTVNP